MKKLIENTKKDFAKLKEKLTKSKKPEPEEVKTSEVEVEKESLPTKDIQEKAEQGELVPGNIIKYAKELTYDAIDEEGNPIPCNTIAEAEILSRLIDIRLFLVDSVK